ncbi:MULTISPECIES: DNA/RNA non-specific endonuclease [Mesorhizobium]|uniref:DNA/RNA non-specific endonuclease n=1 Tax=Mesorhizobium TaxID=68287 RepID=UPI000800DF95|nr:MULTISPECIES: DNA/RNA non-specific endonuclease [Mesorhizobium]OBQ82367.1 nuclease [Mesorhizobium sp. WSM3873]
MASFEERLDSVKQRLTPAVREAIDRMVAGGLLPPAFVEVLAAPTLDDLIPERRSGLEVAARLGATAAGEVVLGRMPIAGLEAIVQRVGRPPLLVRNDKVVLEDLPDFPEDTADRIRAVEPLVPSVGRIEFVNHNLSWGGTGWVVEDRGRRRLVITNRHVAKIVAKRKSDGAAIFLRNPFGAKYGAAIDFIAEVDRLDDTSRTLRLSGVEYLADDLSADVALMRVEADGDELPPPLELADTPFGDDRRVAIIGYPAFDGRNNADDQARYFRDLYEVKRFAPGFINGDPGAGVLFSHDCTTLGGNSGSPLIRLLDGKAVGLHFQGEYGKNNTAVCAATIIALLRGERPVSIRLHGSGEIERPDGHHDAAHFAGRRGFHQNFLGLVTPWPALPDTLVADLARPSDGPEESNELRYTHFGVKYCARRHLPLMTAVNIDGGRAVRIKRGDDQWFSDGRIPREIQLGRNDFRDDQIDRGHMVRREDPNWGEEGEARLGNDDTFHYVNAAAQHSTLNQGKTLWLGLENYILDSARTHGLKACVFTGPVLRRDDEEEEIVIDRATVPIEFWKLVVTLDAADEGLNATAYLLSQGDLIRRLLEDRSRREALEGFTLGEYRTFQISVADLAEATGYDFSAYFAADPLARLPAAAEAAASDEVIVVPLETLADIQLGSEREKRPMTEAPESEISVTPVLRALNDRPDEELAFRGEAVGEEDLHEDPDSAPEPLTESVEAGLEATTRWRAANALLALRKQVDEAAPSRSKSSDGTIGDTRHCGGPKSTSDHCPRVLDNGVAVVTAIDITHDPAHGCDAHAIAEAIRLSKDSRVKYIISKSRIAASVPKGGAAAWAWRPYKGSNKHEKHCHISVQPSPSLFDKTTAWTIK